MAPFRRFPGALALLFTIHVAVTDASGYKYNRIFSFGDSLTDTGNSAILPATAGGPFMQPPYGKTFPGHPSGRASDGLIITDFIAEALGLAQPTPYLAGKTAADFRHGANFAVGGAPALDPAFLASKGIKAFVPVSLVNETSWFDNVLQLLGTSANEQQKITASSLFYLGQIGFNDYSFAMIPPNGSVDLAESLVPHIVGAIRSALTHVIAAGAKMVVVTGMIPIGCEPQMLALYPGDHDPATGCITRQNKLARLHNRALKRMLRDVRRRSHPGTAIHYGDYYRPITAIAASPGKYGFGSKPLAACCGGGGGLYNFDFTAFCGTPGSTACTDPSEYVSWDGIHYTEATNRFVAHVVLRNCDLLGATSSLVDEA